MEPRIWTPQGLPFYPGKEYDFYVLSQQMAKTLVIPDPHIIISITDPVRYLGRDTDPLMFPEKSQVAAVLRLCFFDVDRLPEYPDGTQPMSREQAEWIVDFVEQYRQEVRTIMVHCHAGISRSAGVAAALSLWLEGTDRHFYGGRHVPNAWVRKQVLKALHQRRLL